MQGKQPMSIRRVVPNIKAHQYEESRTFYTDFLGLDLAMDLGWIMTFVNPDHPTTQISVLAADPSGLHPHMSVEVSDIDTLYATAVAADFDIVYPIKNEPWGVRRFFVADPNGMIINIVSHQPVNK
jgi:catechol 2,3-dioxygenase-like lactoylglutathione lyase family enzyme